MKRTPVFSSEDFGNYREITPKGAAQIANAKLDKLIADMPVVYTDDIERGYWGPQGYPGDDTHSARLAFIEELKPKVCEHTEPVFELRKCVRSETIFPGKVGFSYFGDEGWFCRECRAKLKAKWEVCE